MLLSEEFSVWILLMARFKAALLVTLMLLLKVRRHWRVKKLMSRFYVFKFQDLYGIYFSIFTGSHRMGGLESDLRDRHLEDHKTC